MDPKDVAEVVGGPQSHGPVTRRDFIGWPPTQTVIGLLSDNCNSSVDNIGNPEFWISFWWRRQMGVEKRPKRFFGFFKATQL